VTLPPWTPSHRVRFLKYQIVRFGVKENNGEGVSENRVDREDMPAGDLENCCYCDCTNNDVGCATDSRGSLPGTEIAENETRYLL